MLPEKLASVLRFWGDLLSYGLLDLEEPWYLVFTERTMGTSLHTRMQPCLLPGHLSPSARLQPRARSAGTRTRWEVQRQQPRSLALAWSSCLLAAWASKDWGGPGAQQGNRPRAGQYSNLRL